MTDLWTEASRDHDDEQNSRLQATASVASAQFWPFLAAAQTEREFEHRLGCVQDEFLSALAEVPEHIRLATLEKTREDFKVLAASRKDASDRGVSATCPVCYRENVALRNGKLVSHQDTTREGNPQCDGTGKTASRKEASGRRVLHDTRTVPGKTVEAFWDGVSTIDIHLDGQKVTSFNTSEVSDYVLVTSDQSATIGAKTWLRRNPDFSSRTASRRSRKTASVLRWEEGGSGPAPASGYTAIESAMVGPRTLAQYGETHDGGGYYTLTGKEMGYFGGFASPEEAKAAVESIYGSGEGALASRKASRKSRGR